MASLLNFDAIQKLTLNLESVPQAEKPKRKKKKKSKKAAAAAQQAAQYSSSEEEPERPGTPTAAWPPPRINSVGPPCVRRSATAYSTALARAPKAASLSTEAPPQAPSGDMSARPYSARPSLSTVPTRGAAGETASPAGPKWDFDAPLPSIRTDAGREQLLQTPAFVIAAHYMNRGETLKDTATKEDMRKQIKLAAQHQRMMVAEKAGMESQLNQAVAALRHAQEENKDLRLKCDQLTSQVLGMQRSARDGRTASSIASPRAQDSLSRPQISGEQLMRLENELGEAHAEIARLRQIMRRAGLSC